MTRREYYAGTGSFVGAGIMGMFIAKQPAAIIASIIILCIGLAFDFFEPWLLKEKADGQWVPISNEEPEEGAFFWVTDGTVVFESFYVAGRFIAAPGTQVTHFQRIQKPIAP